MDQPRPSGGDRRYGVRTVGTLALMGLALIIVWATFRPDLPPATDLASLSVRLASGEIVSLELVDSTMTAYGRGGAAYRVESVTADDWQDTLDAAMRLDPVPSFRFSTLIGDVTGHGVGIFVSYVAPLTLSVSFLLAVIFSVGPRNRGRGAA